MKEYEYNHTSIRTSKYSYNYEYDLSTHTNYISVIMLMNEFLRIPPLTTKHHRHAADQQALAGFVSILTAPADSSILSGTM